MIRKPSPTFGNIRIESKEETSSRGKEENGHSRNNSIPNFHPPSYTHSLEENLPISSDKNIPKRLTTKTNIFVLMKKIEDIDYFLEKQLNNQSLSVIFIFGPQNPPPLFVEEKTIYKYRKMIDFYYFNVKFIEKHQERFFLNPPLITTYVGNKRITELSYTSEESQIQDILNSFSLAFNDPSNSKNTLKVEDPNLEIPLYEQNVVVNSNSPTSKEKALMMKNTRNGISFGRISDITENKIIYKSQRCSIAVNGVVFKDQLLSVLRGMKDSHFKKKKEKEDYLYFYLYIIMMKKDKPVQMKKELNEERLLRFLNKKKVSGIIAKKMEQNYKDFNLIELINVVKELGLLSKTETYEIIGSLENKKDKKNKIYERHLRSFLSGRNTLKEMM